MIVNLKSSGLWTKIKAIYPFKGNTPAQHKWNAKNPLDTNAAFRLQFFGGGTHSNLGYQCNGINAYANTFLVPSAVQQLNSNGLTVVVGTNNSVLGSDAEEIGSYSSNTSMEFISTKANNTTFDKLCGMNTNTPRIVVSGTNEAKGIFTGAKTSSNLHKLFRNQTLLATGSGGGTLPNVNVWIGALNLNNSAYGCSSQRIQMAIIHDGLTDAEVVQLHQIIDVSEQIQGRKTW